MDRVKSEDSPLYGCDLSQWGEMLETDTKLLRDMVSILQQYEAQRKQLSDAGAGLIDELLGGDMNLDAPVELQKRLQRLLSS